MEEKEGTVKACKIRNEDVAWRWRFGPVSEAKLCC